MAAVATTALGAFGFGVTVASLIVAVLSGPLAHLVFPRHETDPMPTMEFMAAGLLHCAAGVGLALAIERR